MPLNDAINTLKLTVKYGKKRVIFRLNPKNIGTIMESIVRFMSIAAFFFIS